MVNNHFQEKGLLGNNQKLKYEYQTDKVGLKSFSWKLLVSKISLNPFCNFRQKGNGINLAVLM